MKIGILTQPLHNNYGGLLQNYALQTVLTYLGHDVLTINIRRKQYSHPHILMASVLKRSLLKILGKNVVIRTWPTENESRIISKNTYLFIKRHLKTTKNITKKISLKLLDEYGFNTYIVGSDQVWRPSYSPQLSTFFLDFLENNFEVKKIAYAASFGVDDWEFKSVQTSQFSKLIKLFNAISVREDSAINLCKRYFDVEATHLLDPTMLLDEHVYSSLIEEENIEDSPGNLFTYILDNSLEKEKIIDSIVKDYGLNPFSVMPKKSFNELGKKDIHDCVFPHPAKWIKGFMDAQFVVTDSFHGTVFSILFNKPFISIANENRGMTRFTSLLKLFKLEDRLVISADQLNMKNIKEIDWREINSVLTKERKKSFDFLNTYLNPS